MVILWSLYGVWRTYDNLWSFYGEDGEKMMISHQIWVPPVAYFETHTGHMDTKEELSIGT